MVLLDRRGGYLYEHRPDVIPQGFLTGEELMCWSAFYAVREAGEGR